VLDWGWNLTEAGTVLLAEELETILSRVSNSFYDHSACGNLEQLQATDSEHREQNLCLT
jgi:hypothetical protein